MLNTNCLYTIAIFLSFLIGCSSEKKDLVLFEPELIGFLFNSIEENNNFYPDDSESIFVDSILKVTFHPSDSIVEKSLKSFESIFENDKVELVNGASCLKNKTVNSFYKFYLHQYSTDSIEISRHKHEYIQEQHLIMDRTPVNDRFFFKKRNNHWTFVKYEQAIMM